MRLLNMHAAPESSEAGAPLAFWSSPRPPRRTERRASFPENINKTEKTARAWRGEFYGKGPMIPPRLNGYPDDGAPECSPTSQAAKVLSGNWDLQGMDPDALKQLLLSKLSGGVRESPDGVPHIERTMLQVQVTTPPQNSENGRLRRSGQTPATSPLASAASTSGGGGVWVRLEELQMMHALGEGERCMHGAFLPECTQYTIPHTPVSGSAGSTFLAMYQGRKVAVKVANSDRCSVESWRTELAVLTQLRHPSLICCLACVEAPLSFGLVLEYCDGGDVGEALKRPTPPGFFLRVAKGVASAAAYLHQAGYMHRDIKSANVLIDSVSGVKLADLGLARSVPRAGHTVSKWGASKGKLTAETGSFRWMAPEVILARTSAPTLTLSLTLSRTRT